MRFLDSGAVLDYAEAMDKMSSEPFRARRILSPNGLSNIGYFGTSGPAASYVLVQVLREIKQGIVSGEDLRIVSEECRDAGLQVPMLVHALPFFELELALSSLGDAVSFSKRHADDADWRKAAGQKILLAIRAAADAFEASLG